MDSHLRPISALGVCLEGLIASLLKAKILRCSLLFGTTGNQIFIGKTPKIPFLFSFEEQAPLIRNFSADSISADQRRQKREGLGRPTETMSPRDTGGWGAGHCFRGMDALLPCQLRCFPDQGWGSCLSFCVHGEITFHSYLLSNCYVSRFGHTSRFLPLEGINARYAVNHTNECSPQSIMVLPRAGQYATWRVTVGRASLRR